MKNNQSYISFAQFYDLFISDVDYQGQAEFIKQMIKRHSKIDAEIILDVGCGTGNLAFLLADEFKDVIGADQSEEMLQIANEKAFEMQKNILFLNQSGQDLDLYGTIDAAVCTLDTINHVTNINTLKQFVAKVSLFLMNGGVFIFDVNTLYKHKDVLSNNTFVYETDDVFCSWQNEYNEKSKTTTIKLDFFYEQQDGLYEREQEFFKEKFYSDKQLRNILSENGFDVIGVFDDYTLNDVNEKTQRATYVTIKNK